jgi:hypothetical protein
VISRKPTRSSSTLCEAGYVSALRVEVAGKPVADANLSERNKVQKQIICDRLAARSIEDFERIHRSELSKLPKVARIQSSFAIREVVNQANPLALFGKLTVNRRLDR